MQDHGKDLVVKFKKRELELKRAEEATVKVDNGI